MKSKIAMVLAGLVLGGLFMNDKLSVPHAEEKTEIVYGHRIGPAGEAMLVTSK